MLEVHNLEEAMKKARDTNSRPIVSDSTGEIPVGLIDLKSSP